MMIELCCYRADNATVAAELASSLVKVFRDSALGWKGTLGQPGITLGKVP